jgi:hypothetical protein
MSRRSKRRRGLQAAGEGTAAEAGRAPEPSDTGGARRVDRAADAGGGAARGRAGRGGSRGRPAGGAGRPDGERSAARSAAPTWSLGVQLAFLVAVFAVVVLVAELAGAANLGVALGIGQIAFAIAVMYLLVRR